MKRIFIYASLLIISLGLSACHINVNDPPYYIDITPPLSPMGLVVLNGDNRVDISWRNNTESDLAGYNVYYSYSYDGKYTLLGSTRHNYFIDDGAHNGTKYYYAVTAYDYNGNESELSSDVVYATPRPEGFNQSIFDYRNFPEKGGYSFTTYTPVQYDSQESDFFFENYNGTYYLNVFSDSDIQDMGQTNDIYDIAFAPSSGWSDTKDVTAKTGHTYVIWTWDNHYAKVRINTITPDRIVFDWAFQLVKGEKQLKPRQLPADRNPLQRSELRSTF